MRYRKVTKDIAKRLIKVTYQNDMDLLIKEKILTQIQLNWTI